MTPSFLNIVNVFQKSKNPSIYSFPIYLQTDKKSFKCKRIAQTTTTAVRTQRNNIAKIRNVFSSWWTIKTLTANQNLYSFKELKHLNWTAGVGVYSNIVIITDIVIFIVIVIGFNF